MKRIYLPLFLIVIVASIFRFINLGEVPPSPDWDEVSHGYNAYSLLLTGKDEYGDPFPLVLRSFDDYKPALYPYLVIPFILLFDLSIFAVRFPSALFGVLTVLAVYFFIKELISHSENQRNQAGIVGLITAGLLAISPWHIQFSRIAFEANVGLAFNIFFVLFFLLGLRRPWMLSLSTLFMGLSLYAYQSEKVFTPLLALILFCVFWREVFKVSKKYLFLAFVVGFLVSLPFTWYTFTNKAALSRLQGVSVFADQTPLLKENAQRLLMDKENNDILGILLDNRRVLYAKTIISGYLSHFDLNWLFINGDLARHHAPGMGLLYIWELPFLFLGLYYFIFSNFSRKIKIFILLWFLVAPIPASITSGVPHAIRTLNFLPTFQIFIALGLLRAIGFLDRIPYNKLRIKSKYVFVFCFLLFIVFNITYYINQYFVQQNYFYSSFWQYGYKEAVDVVKKWDHKYTKVIVSNEPHLDQSYMFFLFYLKYPPSEYQKEAQSASGGFKEVHRFGKYEFRPINWEKENKSKDILFVGRPDDFPVDISTVQNIDFLDGERAIEIIEAR